MGRLADLGRCAKRNTSFVMATPPTTPHPYPPSQGERESNPVHGKEIEPIGSLLRDPSLTEIMVNGPDAIYVEREGRILLTDRQFADENHLMNAIDALVSSTGRRLDVSDPILEARLPDGSRLTVVLPPVGVDGPMFTIRKFSASLYGLDDLVRCGSLSIEAAAFLRACVAARASLLIAGGASSGKTTLLNALSSCIAEDERIVTIEEAAELQLQQDHVCRLECVGSGDHAMSLRQLVRHAVRMRPDRLIVGEVRGGEALDMLQALNTGHTGAMTTIHANSPRDALSRLETLVLMAGLDLPMRAVRQQIRGAISLVVQVGRLVDGSRKVLSIAEVTGIDDQTIGLQEVFVSEAAGSNGTDRTRLRPTNLRPQIMDKIYRLELAPPELAHVFPKGTAASQPSGRRSEVVSSSGLPLRDRRQS
jgi:pilus assembly protein CpaF